MTPTQFKRLVYMVVPDLKPEQYEELGHKPKTHRINLYQDDQGNTVRVFWFRDQPVIKLGGLGYISTDLTWIQAEAISDALFKASLIVREYIKTT